MANRAQLEADALKFLTDTTGAVALEKQNIRDFICLKYQSIFTRWLTEKSFADNAANRGKFVAYMIVARLYEDYRDGSKIAIEVANPVQSL